ncbi:hypothetical protein BH24ACT5_BH24ACT5_01290 [soil metagenome]
MRISGRNRGATFEPMGDATAAARPPIAVDGVEAGDAVNLQALVAATERVTGTSVLSDDARAALQRLTGPGTTDDLVVVLSGTAPDGVAVAMDRDGDWTIEIVVRAAGAGAPAAVDALLAAALERVRARDARSVTWWVHGPTWPADDLATDYGLAPSRRLNLMRRVLPADRPAAVATRAFVVGVDDDAWPAVNNRAFAGHPEQGTWTHTTLAERIATDWFDPEGFRLHEIDGQVAAFCWTKVHDDVDPRVGEIYVIGVDPDFQGRGLGKELTLAGLDAIVARGVRHGMLYVDADNGAAVSLYERLGFHTSTVDHAYVGTFTTP